MKASVVVPLYDKGPFIKATLESVLAQTMVDFEVIVVDDGSGDEGPAIAASTGDGRVRVASYPNGGVSAARNRGVSLASAELVAFLDADDRWEPRFLETMIAALERHPGSAAAFCAFGEGAKGRTSMPLPREDIVIEDYPGWFIRRRGRGLWSSNNLVRKQALIEAGLFPEGVHNGEDTDTWFRLSFEGSIVYVPKLLSKYLPDDSARASKQGAKEPVVINSIKKALEAGMVPKPARASARIAIDYFRIAYASALAMTGRRKEALAAARGARFRPRLWRSYLRATIAFVLGR